MEILSTIKHNFSFHQKFKSSQYNATIGITGSLRGTSREKL